MHTWCVWGCLQKLGKPDLLSHIVSSCDMDIAILIIDHISCSSSISIIGLVKMCQRDALLYFSWAIVGSGRKGKNQIGFYGRLYGFIPRAPYAPIYYNDSIIDAKQDCGFHLKYLPKHVFSSSYFIHCTHVFGCISFTHNAQMTYSSVSTDGWAVNLFFCLLVLLIACFVVFNAPSSSFCLWPIQFLWCNANMSDAINGSGCWEDKACVYIGLRFWSPW